MNFEKPPQTNEQESQAEARKETPARFRLAVDILLKANFGKIKVKGEENLDKLPPGAKVIIATTHISDFDVLVPIVKLGKRFKIKAVNASLQHDVRKDAMPSLSVIAAGKENTIPVDFKWGKNPKGQKSYYSSSFNPDNFTPMKEALDDGDAILMAAYNPEPIKSGMLPAKGGYGAVYLAEVSDAVIVPVAVNIKSKDPFAGMRERAIQTLLDRPEMEMVIGEPITLDKVSGIERMAEILKQREKDPKSITKNEIGELRNVQKDLQNQSDKIMASLARLLPEEKRGAWGKNIAEGS